MNKLAINGGKPIRTKLFPNQNTQDHMEQEALLRVHRSGRSSGYRANIGSHFYGGPEIKALEKNWANYFNAPISSAIACNSATSGLFIACPTVDSTVEPVESSMLLNAFCTKKSIFIS